MKRLSFALFSLALCLAGCRSGQVPNPNDPNQAGPIRRVELIKEHMQEATDNVQDQVALGHITQETGNQLLADDTAKYLAGLNLTNLPPAGDLPVGMAYLVARDRKDADMYLNRLKAIPASDCIKVARAYLSSGDPATARLYLKKLGSVPPDDCWKVAQVYMDLQDWKSAEGYLQRSLDAHLSTDRTVNDTLFYAYCQAGLGDVDGAIATARKSFSTESSWKWPILYAVHFQIVPQALKVATKAQKVQLGQLIEDAINQHLHATGDSHDPHFQGWFLGRKHLLTVSYQQAIDLYAAVGRIDLANRVEAEREAWHAREPVEPTKLPADPQAKVLRV